MVVSGRSVMTNFEVEDKPFFVARLLRHRKPGREEGKRNIWYESPKLGKGQVIYLV
jgi:hypothetical protein